MSGGREWLIMLMPYFGRWPEWMNLFIESCKWNPGVRWRFFTDCGEAENKAANVDYVQLAFDDYKVLVRERLRTDFDPTDPYKICDVRPAFGDVHARDIAGYRFFGYGDIDLVYGQIDTFYDAALRARSNAISTRHDMFAGHFAILRNNWALRRAYRRIPRFADILAQPDYVGIDERAFYEVFRPSRPPAVGWRGVLGRLDPCRRGGSFVQRHTTMLSPKGWHDGTMNYPQRWFWRRGHLTNDCDGTREFLCLHFMRWKSTRHRVNPQAPGEGAWLGLERIMHADWRELVSRGFCISPAGITPLPAREAD